MLPGRSSKFKSNGYIFLAVVTVAVIITFNLCGINEGNNVKNFIHDVNEISIARINDDEEGETDVEEFRPEYCTQPKHFLGAMEVTKMHRKVFALSSFPGSGNTFVRLILESATRVHTGSVYNDKTLLPVLKGEGRMDGTIFVKTHYPCGGCWTNRFNKPILEKSSGRILPSKLNGKVLLLRNPIKTFLAEFKRRQAVLRDDKDHHRAFFNLSAHESLLKSELAVFIPRWKRHAKQILEDNTLVVYFEDFLENRTKQVLKVVEFVHDRIDSNIFATKEVKLCAKLDIEDGNLFHRTQVFQRIPLSNQELLLFCLKVKDVWNDLKWGKCIEAIAN